MGSIAISRGVTVVLGMVAVCGKSFMAAWNESDRLSSADLFCPSQAAPPGERTKPHITSPRCSRHIQHPCPTQLSRSEDTTMEHTLEVVRWRSASWVSRTTTAAVCGAILIFPLIVVYLARRTNTRIESFCRFVPGKIGRDFF